LLNLNPNTGCMSAIDRIKQPIKEELEQFEHYFKGVMKTSVPLLNLVINYLLKRKGKQMRPILVFLTARLFGKPNESTYTAAALIEIMHTASLIHDDVVDDSNERRGFFSINAIWKSKVSVLLGDYLLASGLLLAVNNKEYEILNLVADAVKEMSEGELQQIKKSRKLNISKDEYYEIIRKKTATLISCCSSCGAKSVGMPDDVVKKMQHFGELLGIAFQIKDDLLDYQINSLSGKPAGNDLKDRKLTLPLIHALESADSFERKKILRLLNNSSKNGQEFHEVMDFVKEHEGLTFAEEKMKDYASAAMAELDEFPNLNIKDSMREFVEYTILRNK
jgi:octaprenyl-diphosphate synthase